MYKYNEDLGEGSVKRRGAEQGRGSVKSDGVNSAVVKKGDVVKSEDRGGRRGLNRSCRPPRLLGRVGNNIVCGYPLDP